MEHGHASAGCQACLNNIWHLYVFAIVQAQSQLLSAASPFFKGVFEGTGETSIQVIGAFKWIWDILIHCSIPLIQCLFYEGLSHNRQWCMLLLHGWGAV
jgi:hypothetical protein